MSTAFFENAHYYSNERKIEDYSPQLDRTDFNDFFVEPAPAPLASFCRDNSTWEYIASQLRQQIFNSTSVSYSSPETYLIKKAKRDNSNSHVTAMLTMLKTNKHTANPFTADPLEFRRYRSENLLMRMIHCRDMDMSQMSLMRLSKGVFVHQIWQSSTPHASPTLSAIEDSLSNRSIDISAEAPINTFRFDNVFNLDTHLTTSCYDMFIPYSYTFGARFTNPYGRAHDLVIRGKVPLWCQTLFLSVCMKQIETIQANVPQYGLFPFAPHVPVTFKPFVETYGITPDLTVLYERYTMEHTDPFAMNEGEAEWPERRQEILQDILVCDLDDGLAKILSDMAIVWATSQGLMI